MVDPAAPGTLTPLREMQLLEAHRRGEPSALAELLAGCQRRVYATCAGMVRGTDLAADLAQDALVKIIEGLESYDGRAAFGTWAIRVTMNCCLSHLRRERLRRHRSLDEPAAPWGEETGGASLPQRGELSAPGGVERSEMHSILLRALGGLDAPMRAILVLRDLHELDYRQIGEILEIPLGTVKSRLFRARAALREATEAGLGAGGDRAPLGGGKER